MLKLFKIEFLYHRLHGRVYRALAAFYPLQLLAHVAKVLSL